MPTPVTFHALKLLKESGLENSSRRQALSESRHPINHVKSLIILNQSNCLMDENEKLILDHPAANTHIAKALVKAIKNDIDTPFLRKLITENDRPTDFVKFLIDMKQENSLADNQMIAISKISKLLLTTEYQNFLNTYHQFHAAKWYKLCNNLLKFNDSDVADFAKTSLLLINKIKLTEEEIISLWSKTYFSNNLKSNLSQLFNRIINIGALTPEVLTKLLNPQTPASYLRKVDDFCTIVHSQNYTLADFNKAFSIGDILINNEVWQYINQIPPAFLNQIQTDQIINIYNQPNGNLDLAIRETLIYLENIFREVNRVLAPRAKESSFNPRQSTHTASVNTSAAESVTKLFNRYQELIQAKDKANNILNEIKDWLKKLDTRVLKNKAALEVFPTLCKSSFREEISKLSLLHLILLFWLGIKDEKNCVTDFESASKFFIDALYEIKRGDNIDSTGKDDGQKAKQICSAGSFNKLIKKLTGIHKDVCPEYMTEATAAIKQQIVLKEETQKYLSDLQTNNYQVFSEIISSEDPMKIIWPDIKSQVSARLLNEFKKLFPDENNPKFIAMLDTSIYFDIDEPDILKNNRVAATSSSSVPQLDPELFANSFWSEKNSIGRLPSYGLFGLHASSQENFIDLYTSSKMDIDITDDLTLPDTYSASSSSSSANANYRSQTTANFSSSSNTKIYDNTAAATKYHWSEETKDPSSLYLQSTANTSSSNQSFSYDLPDDEDIFFGTSESKSNATSSSSCSSSSSPSSAAATQNTYAYNDCLNTNSFFASNVSSKRKYPAGFDTQTILPTKTEDPSDELDYKKSKTSTASRLPK